MSAATCSACGGQHAARLCCPNCAREHRAVDVCGFAFLLGVLQDRLDRALTDAEVFRAFGALDMDALWDDYLGPAVDAVSAAAGLDEEATP